MKPFRYFIVSIAGAGVLTANSALAENTPGARLPSRDIKSTESSRTVGFSDLNLSSNSDQLMLIRRVKQAAVVVCHNTLAQPTDPLVMSTCRVSAWNGARPQVRRAFARAQELARNGQSTIAVSAAVTLYGPQVAAR